MKLSTMLKSALVLGLGFVVGTGYAADESKYTEDFEGYEVGTPINTEHSDPDPTVGFGWYSGEEDQSKVAEGKVLKLNTESDTLTNKFDSATAGALNTAIAADGAYFEMDVKFVASDSLDAGITGGTDDAKFALYAYYNEDADPPYTNLVVFHSYYDSEFNRLYTNDVTDILIDTEALTHVRIDMTQVDDDGTMRNAFTVTVGSGADAQVVTTANAYDSELGSATGSLFLTAEDWVDGTAASVSGLTFKGTGDIDNIAVGTVSADASYVASVAYDEDTDNYETVAEALAAVQAYELAGSYPITVTALADDGLTIAFDNQTITLAKNDTIVITANGWTITGTVSGSVKLAVGKTLVVPEGSVVTVTAPEGYRVVKTTAEGLDTYTVEAVPANTVILISADSTTTNEYATLADAFVADAADEAGVTVKLLDDALLTAELDIVDFNGTLDLNGFELTNDESYKTTGFDWLIDLYVSDASKTSSLTITNGTVTLKDGHMFYVCAGATLTVAAETTIDEAATSGCVNPFRTYGKIGGHSGESSDIPCTVNVYGTMTRVPDNYKDDGEMGVIDQCLGTSVVNVYDGAVLTHANGRLFKMSGGVPTVNVYGGTMTAGGELSEMFHAYATSNTVAITGGEFTMGDLFSGSAAEKILVVSGLGEGCTAKFSTTSSKTKTLAEFCTTGYEPVLEDGWYVIKQAAQGFNYPEGDAIATDSALYAWLVANGATQEAINALGSKAALMEKYLLNLALADSSYELKVSSIAVGETVDVAVTLTRTGALEGGINGTLKLHGAATLGADGEFAEVSGAEFVNGDFASEGPAMTNFTAGEAKFFKAVIE